MNIVNARLCGGQKVALELQVIGKRLFIISFKQDLIIEKGQDLEILVDEDKGFSESRQLDQGKPS